MKENMESKKTINFNNKTLYKHPVHSVYVDTEGNIYSSHTLKLRKCFNLRNRPDGYLQLSIGRNSFLAHRIVAQALIPNPENKEKINHKNGIKSDNRVENLEWVTQKENVIHARDILGVKFSVSGDQHPCTKFLDSHRVILKNLYCLGFTQKDIIKIMGFSQPTIVKNIKRILK